jgi:uncharacterized protein
MERSIAYLEHPGKRNTSQTLGLARQRASELNVRTVVLASTTGFTAQRALTEFDGLPVRLVAVGWDRRDFDPQVLAEYEARGHHVLFAAEVAATYPEVVANAYRKVCEGLKVIMEIVALAVDAGVLQSGEEVIAVAGTGPIAFPAGGGADTAAVVVAAPSAEHAPEYQLPAKEERRRVREFLCMPR